MVDQRRPDADEMIGSRSGFGEHLQSSIVSMTTKTHVMRQQSEDIMAKSRRV